jgi:alanine dehydrogenase
MIVGSPKETKDNEYRVGLDRKATELLREMTQRPSEADHFNKPAF